MPTSSRRPPDDPGRPSPREAIAKARAAAAPRVAKAMDEAAPRVEKAAVRAGKLLGTLRDRAKETAKQFGEGFTGDDDERPESETGGSESSRRRPRPGPRRPTGE
jgi:hypothetical protein